jgi:hypothetical protein
MMDCGEHDCWTLVKAWYLLGLPVTRLALGFALTTGTGLLMISAYLLASRVDTSGNPDVLILERGSDWSGDFR